MNQILQFAMVLLAALAAPALMFNAAAQADDDSGFCETYEPDCDRVP